MTAAVNLRVISVLMHIETMLLYQAHYVVKAYVAALWVHCPSARAVDSHMRCVTISACQSAPTFNIVRRCWSRVLIM